MTADLQIEAIQHRFPSLSHSAAEILLGLGKQALAAARTLSSAGTAQSLPPAAIPINPELLGAQSLGDRYIYYVRVLLESGVPPDVHERAWITEVDSPVPLDYSSVTGQAVSNMFTAPTTPGGQGNDPRVAARVTGFELLGVARRY